MSLPIEESKEWSEYDHHTDIMYNLYPETVENTQSYPVAVVEYVNQSSSDSTNCPVVDAYWEQNLEWKDEMFEYLDCLIQEDSLAEPVISSTADIYPVAYPIISSPQDCDLFCPPLYYSNCIANAPTDKKSRSLSSKQKCQKAIVKSSQTSCVKSAKQISASKRARVKGRFQKAQNCWIPASKFNQNRSSTK